MSLVHLLFDLDNTLYPPARGVVEHVDRRITGFMVARLGLSTDGADRLRARYRDEHGTTMHGLMREHRIDPEEYLACVHAIDVDELLAPDPALQRMLDGLPQTKSVFTNGPTSHAEGVLGRLDVRRCFTEIFSLDRLAYVPKPRPGAYEAVLDALAVAPARCLLIEDRVENLQPAHALGMRTALVGERDGVPPWVDVVVSSVLELPGHLSRVG